MIAGHPRSKAVPQVEVRLLGSTGDGSEAVPEVHAVTNDAFLAAFEDVIGALLADENAASGHEKRGTFTPHTYANRRQRRADVATFQPPEGSITRREMVKQRKKRARGTLDVELRRLQRQKGKK